MARYSIVLLGKRYFVTIQKKEGYSILSTEWIENLLEKIRDHVESRKYRVTEHAISRQKLRSLKLPDIMEVLRNGFHEKEKTLFNNKFQTWNYAIRGKAVDGEDVRVILAFEKDMIIITAIRLPRKNKK
ncbi:MAG: hypothetical protein HW387_486 [Parachlamydiales bacterium]|nr:hypothetical protein [Parachlamydiales bacterium]